MLIKFGTLGIMSVELRAKKQRRVQIAMNVWNFLVHVHRNHQYLVHCTIQDYEYGHKNKGILVWLWYLESVGPGVQMRPRNLEDMYSTD